jgi:hypothetical protein
MKLDVTGRSGLMLGLVSLVAGLSVYLADPTDRSRSFSSQPATELVEIDSPSDAPADGPAPGGGSTPTGGAAPKTLGLQIERTNDRSFLFAPFPQLARAISSRGALKS